MPKSEKAKEIATPTMSARNDLLKHAKNKCHSERQCYEES